MLRIFAACSVLLITPVFAQEAQQPEETYEIHSRPSVEASTYMVAAANSVAAEVGRQVLADGGSAADAAVAVQLMLNLVEPQSSGIGGGAFALYWDASEGALTTFDAREKAPLAATPDYWLGEDGEPIGFFEAVVGGRSAGVPGTLKLLEVLHQKHGRTPWPDLLAPTIARADAGFVISPRMASSIAGSAESGLTKFEAARNYFFTADGQPRAAGTLLKNPDFARTLRLIAAHGSAPFYHGSIAGDIVAAVKTDSNPGILTLEDLAAYEVVQRAPVCATYRGADVCGMGPPSSGGLTVGQILGMLEYHDLPTMGRGAEAWKTYIEASKLAFADREMYMADSDFVDMPEGLLDLHYIADRSDLIDIENPVEKAEAGDPPWDDAHLWSPDTDPDRPGTSHFVIVDKYGDMISMTTTIETGFGSRVMTGGFLLNNELTDFSRAPESDGKPIANRVEGGKRPRSSMAPTIVLQDGEPVLLIGSPGGSRIIGYVVQAIIGVMDWDMDLQEALDMGHVINRNGITDLEEDTEAAALADELGGEINVRNLNSGLQAILIKDGKLIGAADRRREGVALGD